MHSLHWPMQSCCLQFTAVCSMHMLESRSIALLTPILSDRPHPSRMRRGMAFNMYLLF